MCYYFHVLEIAMNRSCILLNLSIYFKLIDNTKPLRRVTMKNTTLKLTFFLFDILNVLFILIISYYHFIIMSIPNYIFILFIIFNFIKVLIGVYLHYRKKQLDYSRAFKWNYVVFPLVVLIIVSYLSLFR